MISPPLALHVEHEVAAADELDDEEESAGSLEAGVETHEEGVVGGRLEDVLLRLHPVDVLVVGDKLLLDHLHGVDPLGGLELHHQHLGVGAAADDLDHVEVAEADHVGLVLGDRGRGARALIRRHQHRLRVKI